MYVTESRASVRESKMLAPVITTTGSPARSGWISHGDAPAIFS
jgi:hypothetical protein